MTKENLKEAPDNQSEVVATQGRTVPGLPNHDRRYWVVVAVAVAAVIALLVVIAMLGAALHGGGRYGERAGMMGGDYAYGGRGERGQMMRGGLLEGESSTTTDVARISGVVTGVDGDTLTVAGNGSTTKVTTSDGTIYAGDDSTAKVNDTVIVIGNKGSDDAIAASRIVISRQ